MTKQSKKNSVILICAVAALLIFSIALDMSLPSYHIAVVVVKKAAVYSLVAVSMNLLNGFTGLFSLGQAGFMLIGAYTYGILSIPVAKRAGVFQYFDGGIIKFSIPEIFANFLGENLGTVIGMLITLILGGILAAFFAFLIGLPVLRLKSDYLAIATLGFAEIIRAFIQWKALGPLTNAANLLQAYPVFKKATPFIIISGICIACIVLLINSSYGRAFKAIRDDEIAAEAMGINLAKHKRLSFIISSFFAGIGGGLLAIFIGTISAQPFESAMTYEILLIVVIGGIGSVTGSILASFLYIVSAEWLLRGLDFGEFLGIQAPSIFKNGFRMVVLSVIIMVIVLFFRKGLMGTKELPDLFNIKLKKKKKEAA